jgi:hypothetical protein
MEFLIPDTVSKHISPPLNALETPPPSLLVKNALHVRSPAATCGYASGDVSKLFDFINHAHWWLTLIATYQPFTCPESLTCTYANFEGNWGCYNALTTSAFGACADAGFETASLGGARLVWLDTHVPSPTEAERTT